MGTITAANAVVMLSVPLVLPVPVQMQGFSADDIFSTDPIDTAELQMGADGILSAGFVFKEVAWNISLQADSGSNDFFDAWYAAEYAAKEKFAATGLVGLSSVGKKFTLITGFLTKYAPMPDAKKTLQPRKYTITWQQISPAVG